jgi:ElaB/YqjD/DUF883 family membrane-anchored ribosome-binding protein
MSDLKVHGENGTEPAWFFMKLPSRQSHQPRTEGEAMSPANERAADRLGQQAKDVGANLKEMGNSVKDAAQEQIERVRDTAADYYEQGRERFMEAEDSFEEYVREHPIKSVLIALGVGYLIGKFL